MGIFQLSIPLYVTPIKNAVFSYWCWCTKYFRKNRSKKIIIYRNAFLRDNRKDGQHGLTFEEFMELFEFLIDNIYIRFGDNIFKQIVIIRMWTNCNMYRPYFHKNYN